MNYVVVPHTASVQINISQRYRPDIVHLPLYCYKHHKLFVLHHMSIDNTMSLVVIKFPQETTLEFPVTNGKGMLIYKACAVQTVYDLSLIHI